MPDDRIILCQPDTNKGCSLCCGLFNFRDLSHDFLVRFLGEGQSREKTLLTYEDAITHSGIRDVFSHICPFQGLLSDSKPGCLIHPLYSGVEGRERSLFSTRICDGFFCPAHTLLSDEEKLFLVENAADWYLYSAAIADPESYSFIYNYVKENCSNADFYAVMINEGLAAHIENLAAYSGVIFCYSISEYNINKVNFCIRYINETRDLVVSRIMKSASQLNANQN